MPEDATAGAGMDTLNILIVDDDPEVGELVGFRLSR